MARIGPISRTEYGKLVLSESGFSGTLSLDRHTLMAFGDGMTAAIVKLIYIVNGNPAEMETFYGMI